MNHSFSISIGLSDFGLCDYAITINDKRWMIIASYLRKHPLYDHIHTAIDLYDCIINDPSPRLKNMHWECTAVDEPGELRLKISIKNNDLNIDVHHFVGSLASEEYYQKNSLVAKNITITLNDYIEAVVYATAHAVTTQGSMGLKEGFETVSAWSIDGHAEIIPYDLFLYLASIVKYGKPQTHIGFEEEFNLINEMASHYQNT